MKKTSNYVFICSTFSIYQNAMISIIKLAADIKIGHTDDLLFFWDEGKHNQRENLNLIFNIILTSMPMHMGNK